MSDIRVTKNKRSQISDNFMQAILRCYFLLFLTAGACLQLQGQIQPINLGGAPGDGTGEGIQSAFSKINSNFASLDLERAKFAATVASAKTIARTDGELVATAGYALADDDGGNVYRYRSSGRSGITIDNGFYITGAGADDYLEAVDKTVARVKQFGAVGDGAADDHSAIQNALTTAYALGDCILEFDPGYYTISQPLTLAPVSNSIIIRGVGRATGANAGTSAIRPTNSFVGSALLEFTGTSLSATETLQMSLIENLGLFTTTPNGSQPCDYAISIENCYNNVFRNCRLGGGKKAAMRIGYGWANRFENVLFGSSFGWGLLFDTTTVQFGNHFSGCFFDSNVMGGLYSPGVGVSLSGCGFESNGGCGLYLNGVRGANVTGCYFEANGAIDYTGSIDIVTNPNLLTVDGTDNFYFRNLAGEDIHVKVFGAGPGGADLETTVVSYAGQDITLADAASTSVSGAEVVVGGVRFTTRHGGTSLTTPWRVNPDIVLNGTAITSLPALPVDMANVTPCRGIHIAGNFLSYVDTSDPHTFVAVASANDAMIQAPARGDVGTGSSDAQFLVAQTYGEFGLNGPLVIRGDSRNGVKPKLSMYTASENGRNGDSGLADSIIDGAPQSIVKDDLRNLSVVSSSNGGTIPRIDGESLNGANLFEFTQPSGGSSHIVGKYFDYAEHQDLIGEPCVFEVDVVPLSKSFSTGFHNLSIIQYLTTSLGSFSSGSSSVIAKHGDTVETTCNTTAASATITVTSADGLRVGGWVAIDGAGASAGTLATKITNISGTTVTLKDAAGTTASGVELLQVPVQTIRKVFIAPDTDGVTRGMYAIRRTEAEAGSRLLITRMAIRAVGNLVPRSETTKPSHPSFSLYDQGAQLGATVAYSFDDYQQGKLTVTGNNTDFNFAGAKLPGIYYGMMKIDSTGGYTGCDWTFTGTVHGSVPTVDTTPDVINVITVQYDGTEWHVLDQKVIDGATEIKDLGSAGAYTIRTNSGAAQIKLDSEEITLSTDSTGALILPSDPDPSGNVTTPTNGMVKYDSTDHQFEVYVNSGWTSLQPRGFDDQGTQTGTTTSFDFEHATIGKLEVTGNDTDFQFSATHPGTYYGLVEIDSTGSYTGCDWTFSGTVFSPGGSVPALDMTADRVNYLEAAFDGTQWYIIDSGVLQ